jgi:hypothetical protein
MCRVINATTNEPNAKPEHDVEEEEAPNATERFA